VSPGYLCRCICDRWARLVFHNEAGGEKSFRAVCECGRKLQLLVDAVPVFSAPTTQAWAPPAEPETELPFSVSVARSTTVEVNNRLESAVAAGRRALDSITRENNEAESPATSPKNGGAA